LIGSFYYLDNTNFSEYSYLKALAMENTGNPNLENILRRLNVDWSNFVRITNKDIDSLRPEELRFIDKNLNLYESTMLRKKSAKYFKYMMDSFDLSELLERAKQHLHHSYPETNRDQDD